MKGLLQGICCFVLRVVVRVIGLIYGTSEVCCTSTTLYSIEPIFTARRIAYNAKRCNSHSKSARLTDRLFVYDTLALRLNDWSYDHEVFTGRLP